jgi:hypothetical protein
MAEREKKGFFLFADGTKSTDPENKNRVAKDKIEKEPKDGKKNKSKLQKESEDEDNAEEEVVVKPPRV